MSVTPDSRLGDPKDHLIADLQRQLAECRAELTQRTTERDEALQREIATAEVLQVINSSPGDLAPVFDVILEKAHTLCGATLGSLVLREGEQLRSVATRGYPQLYAELVSQGFPVTWSPSFERLIDAPFIQIPDARALPATNPITRTGVEIAGIRTILRVPLRKDRELLGSITAQRQEVRPFSESEIALLQNFAAQAVIAMENARLINETREALEQQTATAEILRVINSSPGALAPVFETILEKAHTLCGATKGALAINSSGNIRIVATRGLSEEFATLLRRRQSIAPDGPNARLLGGEDLIHILDIRALQGPTSQAVARLEGVRTILFVALRKDRELLGYITAYRTEIRPFSDKHIALLQSFAAQAVIAMENARLIDETREALEQQTATAEVLGIINSSPGDLTPVFDAILEKAHSLCGIALGSLELYDGERFRAVAIRGLPEAFADMLRRGYPASDNPATRPLIEGGRFTHIRDLAETEYAITQSSAELDAARTLLCVPLHRDNVLLGMIACGRREVRPFSEKEITLLESFAAQAVIAMENARLLNEIRQRQAELRVTFDNMADGVGMFDRDLRLTAWNRNFQQFIDLPDEVLEKRPTYASYLHTLAERGEFGTEDVEAGPSLRLDGIDRELRLERTRPDGRVLEVRRNAMPDGGFVLIYSDITERKHSEIEIRTARDAAETALRNLQSAQASLVQAQKMAALGQLTAGIAHEIKNPLNFVNNFAGLSIELLDELKESAAPGIATLDEDIRAEIDETVEMLTSNLDKIAEHGKRADNIVKSMLEHSRGVSGERREVDLNALIDEALNLAYHGARAQDASSNITLERDFQPGLAPIEVAPQEITRVFLNLFSNAFYAATRRQREGDDPQFKPTLKVTTRTVGDAIEITVRDNGTGIPPETRDRLFQPFFTTKPTGEGTGLGLSISYDIITQQHGGTITVDSEPGAYTVFTIHLPRRAAARGAT